MELGLGFLSKEGATEVTRLHARVHVHVCTRLLEGATHAACFSRQQSVNLVA